MTCVGTLLNTEASSLVFTEVMHNKLLRGFSCKIFTAELLSELPAQGGETCTKMRVIID